MREPTNTPRITDSFFNVCLQDTITLGCKPSQAKKSEDWFIDSKKSLVSSNITTQNGFSYSDLELSQESILAPSIQSEVVFSQEEVRIAVESQRKKMVEGFEEEMGRRMDELEAKICKKWEDAVYKMHMEYQQKIEKQGEMMKEAKKEKGEKLIAQRIQLEQEVNERCYREYVEKLELLNENLQKTEQERFMGVIEEVKNELEVEFKEDYEARIGAIKEEIEMEVNNEKEKASKDDKMEQIEREIKDAYEIEMTDFVVRNERDLEALRKEMGKMNAEKMREEIKEELGRVYMMKEDRLNIEWKEKLEVFKKEINEAVDHQRTKRLSQEFLDLAIEKKGIATAMGDKGKAKKVEEGNKELENKLVEQEKKYRDTLEALKGELEGLRARGNGNGRTSVRNSSIEKEGRKVGSQKSQTKSTEKLRKSWDFADLLKSHAKATESVNKADTWRPRRDSGPNMSRRESQGAKRSPKRENQSPEVKRNLSKTLMRESFSSRQNSSTKLFNFERATKEILHMLSPSSPTKIQYTKADSRPVSVLERRSSGPVNQCEDVLKQKSGNTTERRSVKANEDKGFTGTAKYEKLLRRQENTPRKREGSLTQRKENIGIGGDVRGYGRVGSNVKENGGRNVNVYRKLFEITTEDSEENKTMKKLKKSVEESMKENELLSSKCSSKEVELCVAFPSKIGIESPEKEGILREKLKSLFKLWKTVEVSNVTRIAFMEGLEKLLRYEDIIEKLDTEIAQMTQLKIDTEDVVKLLLWRTQLRDQINTENFSYSVCEKVYEAIENNCKELEKGVEKYQEEHGRKMQFRGVDLQQIIKLDSWEAEYLKNLKPQKAVLSLSQRIKQKIEVL